MIFTLSGNRFSFPLSKKRQTHKKVKNQMAK